MWEGSKEKWKEIKLYLKGSKIKIVKKKKEKEKKRKFLYDQG